MCSDWDPDSPNILDSDKVCRGDLFTSQTLSELKFFTTLMLFSHVKVLCGNVLFIKLSEGPVQLSDSQTDTPSLCAASLSVHTGSGCQ